MQTIALRGSHISLFRLAVLSVLILAFASPVGAFGKPQRPNVVFVVVDDLACYLGCYGSADVKTPNIDRLAAKGVRFDRAYCQWPVCNASRTSFLTGLRPDATGIFDNETPFRRKLPDVVTLPQLFRQNGYFTSGLGKIIHQGLDADGKMVFFQDAKSWDDCRSFVATAIGKRGEGRNVTGGAIKPAFWLSAEGDDDDQPDGQLAAAAVKIMEDHRGKPFFLAVGFNKPHDPFSAPKKYFDLYPPDKITLHHPPADRTPELPLAISKKHPLCNLAEQEARELKRAYYACTSFTDAQFGKLLDTLDRLKLWDNTIVILIGDHGYHLGEHDWWNKVTLFEMCARAPLLVWAPGAKGMGSLAAGLVEYVDLYPTLADLCGLDPSHQLAGTSFRPQLNDPKLAGKAAAFTQVNRGKFVGRTVRTNRWRYTEWDEGKAGVELYDHNGDAQEYHNLTGRPESAETERELKRFLQRQQK